MADNEITAIVERLRAGRCVLCAGPRLAKSGPADGGSFCATVTELLKTLPDAERADAEKALEYHPLAAAGFVRRRLGDRFAPALKRATDSDQLPEVAQILGSLPFRAIVTTAYNDTFERAFTRNGAPPKVYTPVDTEALRKDGRLPFVF